MTIRSNGFAAAGALAIALFTGTACAADAPAGAPAAAPADYAVLNLSVSVNAPMDVVWQKVGGYCDIQAWLKLPCSLTSGTGEVGSIRHLAIGKGVDEIMVAKTAHSYTYTQPDTTILYHGTLQVVADGKGHSKLLYNLIWNQGPDGTDDAKAKDRDRRNKTFTGALQSMKALVEGK
ncbi:MAG TPA: SRPBCC family protein [Steroidobacteraceae bacterium]|nr:SRPBCC family protein [Steroidobacteraceae bacterium]